MEDGVAGCSGSIGDTGGVEIEVFDCIIGGGELVEIIGAAGPPIGRTLVAFA